MDKETKQKEKNMYVVSHHWDSNCIDRITVTRETFYYYFYKDSEGVGQGSVERRIGKGSSKQTVFKKFKDAKAMFVQLNQEQVKRAETYLECAKGRHELAINLKASSL